MGELLVTYRWDNMAPDRLAGSVDLGLRNSRWADRWVFVATGIGAGCSKRATGDLFEGCRRWETGTAGGRFGWYSEVGTVVGIAVAVRDAQAQRFDRVVLCDAAFRSMCQYTGARVDRQHSRRTAQCSQVGKR